MKSKKEGKKTEEELKESEKTYRAIFEGANEGILGADSKTKKFILANPQICKLLGYTEKELTKLGVPDIHPKKDLPYVLQQFKKQARGEITVAKDLPVLRKDKKIIYCDVSAKIMQIDSKKVMLGLFSDTTERRKAEEELKEKEERYRVLYKISADAIMTLEPPKWEFTAGNPAAIKMFRCKDEKDFTARAPYELSPQKQPDGQPSMSKALKMINTAMEKGSNFFEWTHRKANGEDFPATVLLSRIEIKGKKFLQATVRDISLQKQAEEELKKSEKTFEDLYEASIMLTGSHRDVLQKICDKVHSIFDGFFVLVNYAKAGEFHFKAGCNLPKEIIFAGKEPIKGAICSHILENKKPLFTNELDKAKCPTCKMPYMNDPAVNAFKLKTYFGVPLIFSDGSIRGTLCIVFKEKKELFTEKDQKIMSLLSKRVATEVEREEEEAERKKKTDEIEKFTKFAVGREIRMMELKQQMAALGQKKVNK